MISTPSSGSPTKSAVSTNRLSIPFSSALKAVAALADPAPSGPGPAQRPGRRSRMVGRCLRAPGLPRWPSTAGSCVQLGITVAPAPMRPGAGWLGCGRSRRDRPNSCFVHPVAGLVDISGPEFEGVPPHWLCYVQVDDVDAAVATATAAGATVIVPVMGVEGVGRFAQIKDAEGAVMGLIASAAPA